MLRKDIQRNRDITVTLFAFILLVAVASGIIIALFGAINSLFKNRMPLINDANMHLGNNEGFETDGVMGNAFVRQAASFDYTIKKRPSNCLTIQMIDRMLHLEIAAD